MRLGNLLKEIDYIELVNVINYDEQIEDPILSMSPLQYS